CCHDQTHVRTYVVREGPETSLARPRIKSSRSHRAAPGSVRTPAGRPARRGAVALAADRLRPGATKTGCRVAWWIRERVGGRSVYQKQQRPRPWGTVALFLVWLGTMVVLGLGLVSVLLSGFFQLADVACMPSARYPCTPEGMAMLTGVARYGAPAAAL